MNERIYQKKQEWLENVMASELNPAQKIFAYSIYKRCFGKKVSSYPATEHVESDTNLSRSKFSKHRAALFDCGALTGVKDRRAAGRQMNYTYTLNLDWDGQVRAHVPIRKSQAPSGTPQAPSRVDEVPRGSTNTPSNTSKKTSKKTSIIAPVVPTVASDSSLLEEVSLSEEDSLVSESSSNLLDSPSSSNSLIPQTYLPWSNVEDGERGLTSRQKAKTRVPSGYFDESQDDFDSEEGASRSVLEVEW